jgi:hypothetical protein
MTSTSWKVEPMSVDALIDTCHRFAQEFGNFPVRIIRDMPLVPDDACYVVNATRSMVLGRSAYRHLEESTKTFTRVLEDLGSMRTLCGMSIEKFSPGNADHRATFAILTTGLRALLTGHALDG